MLGKCLGRTCLRELVTSVIGRPQIHRKNGLVGCRGLYQTAFFLELLWRRDFFPDPSDFDVLCLSS